MGQPSTHAPEPTLIDVLDRVLTKGIVILYDVDVSVVGLQLVGLHGHVVMMSLETYTKMGGPPALDGSTSAAIIGAADEFLKNLPHEGPQIG